MSQALIVLAVSGRALPISLKEAAHLVEYLRVPSDYLPSDDPGIARAAAFLEQVLHDPAGETAKLDPAACVGLLLALGRMSEQEGLPVQLAAIREALLEYSREPTRPSAPRRGPPPDN